MSPYSQLRAAIQRKGGVCTPYEVRHELAAHLSQFAPSLSAWGRKFWGEVMTREEYLALLIRKEKRKKRCANCKCKPCQCHEQAETRTGQVEMYLKNPLAEEHTKFGDWINAFAQKQQEDDYHGEF